LINPSPQMMKLRLRQGGDEAVNFGLEDKTKQSSHN